MHPWSCPRVVQIAGISVSSLFWILQSFALEPKVIPGHVPAAAKLGQPVGRLAAERKLNLAIGLPLHNGQALTDILQQIYDPSSALYHHYLTPEQFTARFGPTETDYQAVQEFVRSNGLTITATHPNRVLLDVSGSARDIERAWHINLRTYQHPAESRTFYAPDVEPTAPAGIHILHIAGLDNFMIPHPASLRPVDNGNPGVPLPQAGSGPGGAYRGKDFRGAYARGVTLDGSGQMLGLLEFDGYYQSDITSYENQSSVANVPIINVTMDGFDGTPGSNNVEVALDIEMASSIAPGLSAILAYEAGPAGLADDILNRMATDNLARQLSASWTFPVDSATEQIFQQFAAQGQSYFNASGDNGAYSGNVNTPADNPNVTVVGGTVLTTTGPGGAWVSETVWNRGGAPKTQGATGGGISSTYPIPSWQRSVNMTFNQGSTSMRNLPDVAAVAEAVWVTFDSGNSETVGGTSCSAPLWAGVTALVNQQSANFGRPPIGFLNPAVYSLGLSAGYNTNFHDITSGNNTNSASPTQFYAAAGYDLCTGWGSPLVQNLINALAPRYPAPLITNGGASILVEGCSPANGAVDPGETVTVSFGLRNLGAVKTTNLVATLVEDDAVRWPSAPQSYGALPGSGATASRVFTFTANGECGSTLAATLNLQDGSNNLGNLTFNFPLGKPVIVLTQNFDAVTAPRLPSDWTTTASNGVSRWATSTNLHDTVPNAAFADEPPSPGTEDLISPPITIVSSNAQLSFRNNFNTEADPTNATEAFDGGVLEIRIGTNDFVDILAAGGSFVSGGYTRIISTETNSDNPLTGRQAWGGNSGGFISSVVNLPPNAAGQTIQLQWRFGVDTGNYYGGSGWYIDSLSIRDGGICCNPSADVALFESTSPEPVGLGQILTYSIVVSNLGPGSAFGVMVSNELPNTVFFSSGSAGCTFTNGIVLCDAGTVPAGTTTNYSFQVVPTTTDSITNLSAIAAFTPDPDISNNALTTVSTVSTNAAPVVYLQSTNAVAARGGIATLQANAFGVTPLAFQWFFNGNPLAGQTSAALSLTNLQSSQSGAYSVVVTNVNGATTSSVAQVTVVLPPTLQLTGVGSNAGNLSVSLPSVAGLTYTLEYKDALSDPSWTPILPPANGTGMPLSLVDTNAPNVPARFYRVTAQ